MHAYQVSLSASFVPFLDWPFVDGIRSDHLFVLKHTWYLVCRFPSLQTEAFNKKSCSRVVSNSLSVLISICMSWILQRMKKVQLYLHITSSAILLYWLLRLDSCQSNVICSGLDKTHGLRPLWRTNPPLKESLCASDAWFIPSVLG